MAEILLNIEGYGRFSLTFDLHDPGEVEVWNATFKDQDSGDIWDVYFEMESDDYEIWDLIDVAIQTYRDEYEPDQILD